MRTASPGTFTFFASPISAIRPFLITTVWFASTRSRSIGITLTLVKATVWAIAEIAAKPKIRARKSPFI
jgi:hypothetical protein